MRIINTLVAISFSLCFGCATTGPTVPDSTKTIWNQMVGCADEAKVNPLRAKCDERFSETPITAPIDNIKLTSFGAIVYLAITKPVFLGHSNLLSCVIGNKEDIAKLEKMSPGDLITVQGKMSEISRADVVTIISFNSCEIKQP